MTAPVEVRRFLHVNYNCRDGENLERFYVGVFGLKPVMRTTSHESEGLPFGIYGKTASQTVFLYDHRGGRRSNAFELVQWTQPPTFGSVYPQPWYRGIQSAAFSVSDLDAAAASAVELGGEVVRRGDSWLLLRDPEGVAVEVVRADGPSEAKYLRIVVSDLERSLAWWRQLGFTDAPQLVAVPGHEIWPAEDGHALEIEHGMVGTDDPSFGIIFTTWSGPDPTGPTYALPYHQGLYRMAMAVDDVRAAHAALVPLGVPRQPPYTFQLPGTKLVDGLTILFIRDPDLVLVELVDRPRQGPS
jgi:catechol 2,3-dioxygenase-like lactoylglutathione lyase family enzyme